MGVRDSLISITPVAPGEVLVVDDEEATRRDVLRLMAPLALLVSQAETGLRALEVAQEKAKTLDCILLDLGLPDMDGWELLKRLRREADTANISVVVLTNGPPGEAEMLRMIEAGVLDSIAKPIHPTLLMAKVKAVCDRSRTQRELQNKLQFALENAAHDALTGLFNRRYFERRLREECAHARRHLRPFSLVMLDLDHFKLVNDTYGHDDGDRVLRHMADVIQAQLREDDVACRYGGEEFVLLLRATTGMAARVVANRLRSNLANRPIALGDKREPKHITFSAGVAAADERNGFNADDIVQRADQALYRAKRAGRNRVETE
ncbi:MAG: diguanylate cyclase [Deltaproteobacteria bacterium]|nr:diguanylate cyclase [Deltaproteobacteria bacterium]